MDTSSETDKDSDYYDDEFHKNSSPAKINYDLVLCGKTWEKIAPVQTVYKDKRLYEKLKSGWTDIIAEKMWKVKKAPCCYKFKKHIIYKKKGKPYFEFFGNCTECGAKFSGICNDRPSETKSSVTINITAIDTFGIPHKKKRFIARERRKVAKESLQYIKPKHFKMQEAHRLMNDSDPIPALLSNSLVYEQLKQEAINEKLQLEMYPGQPIESLHAIMDGRSEIKVVSTNPFIVMYWTEQQIILWNEVNNFPEVVTSIDASGGFVKKVNIIDENYSSPIFLYVIVVNFAGKIFPVAQMLSDSHNTNTISDFLIRIKEDGGPTPKNIVSDCSLALLNSISLSYNSCSYNQYLVNCFDILQQQKSILPSCLIKRDRNHLIKNVTKWKCFSSSQDGVKDFFTRSIAYSLEIENFQLLEEVIMSIFIVAQSNNCDENSECDKRKKFLMKKIETFDYKELFVQTEYGENQYHEIQFSEVEDINEMSNKIVYWLHELNQKCKVMCSNDATGFPKPNFLQCEEMIDNIILLYSQFPAWTNVMHSYYPEAKEQSSSTCSECYNMIMKTVYEMNHPQSVNRFVLNHLNFIVPEIRIGRGILKNISKTDQVRNTTTKLKLNNVQVMQINQNVLKNISKTQDHVTNTPISIKSTHVPKNKIDQSTIKNVSKTRNQEINKTIKLESISLKNHNCKPSNDIILNGIQLPPVCISNHMLQLKNTCPFDSITELFIEAYNTIPHFKCRLNEFLTRNTNHFLKLIKNHAWSDISLEELYIKRAEIMLKFCKSCSNVLDCEMNVTTLYEKLTKGFSDFFGLVSCNICKKSRTLYYQSKILQEFCVKDSKTCNEYLLSAFSENYISCRNCSNVEAITRYILGPCIVFDVEYVFEKAAESLSIDSMPSITNLPKYLPLILHYEEKSYKLVGFISFTPVKNKKGSHYVAYLRKPEFWEKKNDMTTSVEQISAESIQCFVAFIIYVIS